MRNPINLCCSMAMLLVLSVSCSQDNGVPMEQVKETCKLQKFPNPPIEIWTGNESIVRYLERQEKAQTRIITLLRDSVWSSKKGHTLIYENDEIVASDVNLQRYIYLGSILKGGSLETMRYEPVIKHVDPITISYSFPAKYVVAEIARPSLSTMRQSISNTMMNNEMSGNQLASFDYDMTQIYCYDELKLAFGSNVNIAKIVDISADATYDKIKSKSALFARIIQKNFTVDMDIPEDGNLLQNNNELETIEDYSPVYVSSITYGRLGTAYVEADTTYQALSAAVKAAFKAPIVNGEAEFSLEYKRILEKAYIRVHIIGGRGEETVKTVEGLPYFMDFITSGGVYTPTEPGVPIYFSTSYLTDNSPFYTRFNVNILYE